MTTTAYYRVALGEISHAIFAVVWRPEALLLSSLGSASGRENGCFSISTAPPCFSLAARGGSVSRRVLPPLVEPFDFNDRGQTRRETVSLTDGGVYDNLGVAVLEPGRADDSILQYPVTHLISLNAGAGQYTGSDERHFWWAGRVAQSFNSVHRKSQDAVYQRLHKYAELGELAALGMVYLGQQDSKLPWQPADLVRREQVRDYPTDFAPMSDVNLTLLIKRGEQLTHLIVDRYLSELSG